ncbi:transmembrane protein 41 homolog [Lepeophtheirus salmonis]|uniref:transmembrane protein 41 homolog n=1 Tax=Lepeophtheirus salmonis TaxID=72036 RepID=UPI001AE445F7|nr:transmembrane protein 41 homolog [Lepeophtheirus salmonis]
MTTETELKDKKSTMSTKVALTSLILIFLTYIGVLIAVYLNLPDINDKEAIHIKFPSNIEEAKSLGMVLSQYSVQYYLQVLIGVTITYLFLQTFAIPGSIFLSIVAGFLFPFYTALIMVCFCSATGALCCYLLSHVIGKCLIQKYIPAKVHDLAREVEKHRDNMFIYILFLRITPLVPNWLINITSPILEVDVIPFWFGTFFGVAPPSIVAIKAGKTLQEMTSTADAFSYQSIILLFLISLLCLLPIGMKKLVRT